MIPNSFSKVNDQALSLIIIYNIVDLGLVNFLVNLIIIIICKCMLSFTNKGPHTAYFRSILKSFCPLVFFSCFGLVLTAVIYAYFAICVTSTLLLLLLQTKAHIHTTQVKAPCTRRQCCSVEHLSVLLSSSKMHPFALILHFFFHEGCMFLLPNMDFNVESWCKFYTTSLKSTQGIRHVRTPGKQRFRTQWSLPLCVFTCELSHNPILQPTTISSKTALDPHPQVML